MGLARTAWEATAVTQLTPQTIPTLVDRRNPQRTHQEMEITVSEIWGGKIKYSKGCSAIESVFKCSYYTRTLIEPSSSELQFALKICNFHLSLTIA